MANPMAIAGSGEAFRKGFHAVRSVFPSSLVGADLVAGNQSYTGHQIIRVHDQEIANVGQKHSHSSSYRRGCQGRLECLAGWEE
jgi:hypothetical protein